MFAKLNVHISFEKKNTSIILHKGQLQYIFSVQVVFFRVKVTYNTFLSCKIKVASSNIVGALSFTSLQVLFVIQ